MRTTVVVFPFDLFGIAGAGAGATLLADELREALADNRRERVPTRARAYTEHVRLKEAAFDTVEACAAWRKTGRQLARQALRGGDFLVWLGGNHLGALPVYDELAGREDVLVVQFDAHLDVHHFADCTTEPSHGNFLLHVAGRLPPLVNVGHRELLLPSDHVAGCYRATFPAADLHVNAEPALAQLREQAGAAERVFIDIDCDVFDPAFVPATGRPAPFGLSPGQVLRLLDAVWSPKVAGLLLTELDPARDKDDRGLATVMWLLEYLLLRVYEAAV
jgi:arginase family enzyme